MKRSNQWFTVANKWRKDEGGLCACWLVKKINSDRGADSFLKNIVLWILQETAMSLEDTNKGI